MSSSEVLPQIVDPKASDSLYEEREKGSAVVYMQAEKMKNIAEGDSKRLFTCSLMGCTAIGMVGLAERKKWYQRPGGRVAYLRHASPIEVSEAWNPENGVELPRNKLTDGKAVIMTPGKGEPFSAQHIEGNQEDIRLTTREIQRLIDPLSEAVGYENVTIVPYDDTRRRTHENAYAHSMVIDIKDQGSGTIVADGEVHIT